MMERWIGDGSLIGLLRLRGRRQRRQRHRFGEFRAAPPHSVAVHWCSERLAYEAGLVDWVLSILRSEQVSFGVGLFLVHKGAIVVLLVL